MFTRLTQFWFLGYLSCLVVGMEQGLTAESWVIAHRGGVVDAQHSENSLSGLEEAIRRGYTHVEVDARSTRDGHVICFHNDSLMAEAGVDLMISETDLVGLEGVKLTRSKESIPTIDQYLNRCAGRIDVMIDLKGCAESLVPQYASEILAALERYQLMKGALILVNKRPINHQDRLIPYFLGRVKISFRGKLEEARQRAQANPAFVEQHYVFNHGADFEEPDVVGFQALGLAVVVSINTQHYVADRALSDGEKHVRKMIELAVSGFQIDSVYDKLVFELLSDKL